MKNLLLHCILLAFLSSCITTARLHYSDPNYLGSKEFSSFDNTVSISSERLKIAADTANENYDNDYSAIDYYDYSYSSRIRRFHRPMYYSNYYGGLYTDYYWYNNDPFYCGTSIYYGYNWHSPYYSYYSYSPYYYNYYNPYQYSSYNSYGYNHNSTYTYDKNYTTTGHRGSLSSYSNSRGMKTNANAIISNVNSNTSTLHLRNKDKIIRNNTNQPIIEKDYSNRGNTKKIRTNTSQTTIRTNNSNRHNNTYRPSTKRRNNSYTTPKRNNRNKSYNTGQNRANSSSRSSGSSNNRSVKPRK